MLRTLRLAMVSPHHDQSSVSLHFFKFSICMVAFRYSEGGPDRGGPED